MGLLSFSAAPVEPNEPKKKFKKNIPKPIAARRRVDPNSQIYGDKLFQSARNPEKEIVICFWPFTQNSIRIAKSGEFAIKYEFIVSLREEDEGQYINQFTLFHFFENIEFEFKKEDKNTDFIIEFTENVEAFGPFETVLEIRDKILQIVKVNYLQKQANKLAILRANELQEKLEKERIENEQDRIESELAEAGVDGNFFASQSETTESSEASEESQEIYIEKSEETIEAVFPAEEIGTPTAGFLGEIEPLDMKPPHIKMETFPFEAEPEDFKKLEEIKPKTESEIWMERFGGK